MILSLLQSIRQTLFFKAKQAAVTPINPEPVIPNASSTGFSPFSNLFLTVLSVFAAALAIDVLRYTLKEVAKAAFRAMGYGLKQSLPEVSALKIERAEREAEFVEDALAGLQEALEDQNVMAFSAELKRVREAYDGRMPRWVAQAFGEEVFLQARHTTTRGRSPTRTRRFRIR